MSARSEIETTLASVAATLGMPVSYENVLFVRPQNGKWIEIFILGESASNRNVAWTGYRKIGTFAINVYWPLNEGLGDLEAVVESIRSAFPVIPKLMNTVSIDSPLSRGRSMILDQSILIPISGAWRVET